MIIKFKPRDFEECLMGMPIDNWLLVDDFAFEDENKSLRHVSRPKMLISHIQELDGIQVKDNKTHIRGYTKFDALIKSDLITNSFKNVLKRAQSEVLMHHQTLGCYLTSYKFDRYLYPYLVASKSTFILKSYMLERKINFSQFALSGNLQFTNYNEILYEIVMPGLDYDYYQFNTYDYEEMTGDNRFSYFCGIHLNDELVESVDLTIMLPNRVVVHLNGLNDILMGQKFVTISQYKEEIYRYCYDHMVNLRLQLKYRSHGKALIDALVWTPLMVLQGGNDDKKRENTR